ATQAAHDFWAARGWGGAVEGDGGKTEGLVPVHSQVGARGAKSPIVVLVPAIIHRVRAVPDAGESAIGIGLARGVNALHDGCRVGIQPSCAPSRRRLLIFTSCGSAISYFIRPVSFPPVRIPPGWTFTVKVWPGSTVSGYSTATLSGESVNPEPLEIHPLRSTHW